MRTSVTGKTVKRNLWGLRIPDDLKSVPLESRNSLIADGKKKLNIARQTFHAPHNYLLWLPVGYTVH